MLLKVERTRRSEWLIDIHCFKVNDTVEYVKNNKLINNLTIKRNIKKEKMIGFHVVLFIGQK